MVRRLLALLLQFALPLAAAEVLFAQESDSVQHEETMDYYGRWLGEDVVFIITDEEKSVFRALSTPEEKERFIEQFWLRRDPDPRTAENEFKTEHYRRIAYANERFASGYPGWKTDRGRVYILHGPPAEIESHASGGAYQRPMNEGGGATATFPFEVWTYRNISGVGDDIQLEFVDRSLTGEYRLALRPEEKDALLHVPGQGMTAAEELGIATKADRPYFNALKRDYPMMEDSARDNPFYRYETYTLVQGPKEIKYDDLKELVKVDVSFNNLPFEIEQHFFHLNAEQVLAPVTLQLDNRNLTFQEEYGVYVGRVAVYGVVTTISNRLVTEFEHDLVSTYAPDKLETGRRGKSVYQKVLLLDGRQRYRLDLVVKDLNSSNVGVLRTGLLPPSFDDRLLTASSVILADAIQSLETPPDEEEMFVIGDLKVLPNLDHSFRPGLPLGLYFQVYNAVLDESTFKPSLEVSYRLYRDGRLLRQTSDLNGESVQYYSSRRVVFVKLLSVAGLDGGRYRLRIQVADRLSGQELELNEDFTVDDPQQSASSE